LYIHRILQNRAKALLYGFKPRPECVIMGRKANPNNIREMHGDRNKNRMLPDGVQAEKLTHIPAPPKWLFDLDKENLMDDDCYSMVATFNEKAKILVGLQLLTDGDIDMLAMLSALQVKIILCYMEGKTPSMSMYTQYKAFASEFGLSTVSREKLRGNPETKKTNRFSSRKRK
jgi:hypothetical protein